MPIENVQHVFVCPTCRSALTWGLSGAQCELCRVEYPIAGGVPLFCASDAAPTDQPSGLAEATFRNPGGYALVVKAKRAIYQDAQLGTEEHIRNQVVLDVGCGPNLDFEHLENHHALAKRYVGIDLSAEFVLSARRRHGEERYAFAQASAVSLPLPNKSVDTSILSFTLHHVSGDPRRLVDEMVRVTRSKLIILDHLRSERALPGTIQRTYWRFFDGGCNYLSQSQWEDLLQNLHIQKRVQTGAIFGHVVKFLCAVP